MSMDSSEKRSVDIAVWCLVFTIAIVFLMLIFKHATHSVIATAFFTVLARMSVIAIASLFIWIHVFKSPGLRVILYAALTDEAKIPKFVWWGGFVAAAFFVGLQWVLLPIIGVGVILLKRDFRQAREALSLA